MDVEEATLEVPAHDREEHPKHQKLVIIAWGGELDRIWPTMILATTGAAMGMETTVFYTFWAMMTLVKDNKRITGDNWMQKMMALMDRPGMEHLKLGKMNFVGAGSAMMKKLAKDQSAASPGELLDLAVDMGVKLVPCQITMDLLGLKREDMIDGVSEPAGATTMLMEAQDAITLFI